MNIQTIINIGIVFVGVFFSLWLLLSLVFTVQQQTAVIVQRFGRFQRVARAGLNFKIPFIDSKAGELSLRVKQLDVRVQTKTKDNVFVDILVSVQYNVLAEKVSEAFYRLENAEQQIEAYVFDVVRALVPTMALDAVFENKDEIADSVKSQLAESMDDFGYGIVKALVTDIDPDEKVKEAMNEINAATRMRIATTEKAEAARILLVKEAEAEAESKELQGKGIAAQRREIIAGLQASVAEFQQNIEGTQAMEVMTMVLMTQYFDTLQSLGQNGNTNTIMIPSSPGHLSTLAEEIRNSLILANTVASPGKNPVEPGSTATE